MYAAADDPISEIGEILAAGLMRVLTPKSSQTLAEPGEISLDILQTESGHAVPQIAEER